MNAYIILQFCHITLKYQVYVRNEEPFLTGSRALADAEVARAYAGRTDYTYTVRAVALPGLVTPHVGAAE